MVDLNLSYLALRLNMELDPHIIVLVKVQLALRKNVKSVSPIVFYLRWLGIWLIDYCNTLILVNLRTKLEIL